MPSPQPVPAGFAHRGTVLVVDDDEGVLHLTARFLVSEGYTVVTAADGLQALEIISRSPGSPDLVVSDLRMPRMDGHQLAAQLLRRRPPTRMLFISGFAGERPGSLPGPLLSKPFSRDALLGEVRRLLGA